MIGFGWSRWNPGQVPESTGGGSAGGGPSGGTSPVDVLAVVGLLVPVGLRDSDIGMGSLLESLRWCRGLNSASLFGVAAPSSISPITTGDAMQKLCGLAILSLLPMKWVISG